MAKILYLDHAPVLGGAEVVLLNLLRELDRAHWNPLVVTASNADFLAALTAQSVDTMVIPFGRLNQAGPAMPLNLLRAALAVQRIARQQQIDLIHSNTVRAHIVGGIAARLARIPLVWTLHDNTFPPRLVRALASIPRRVIAVSHWLGAYYAPLGLAPKLQIIYNGLPLNAPLASGANLREELSIPADAPLVVNVGRLVEGKAPHLYVQAAQLVYSKVPASYFVLVGGADPLEPGRRPSLYPEQLAQTVQACNLGSHLLMTGQRGDVARFYAAADIAVYNSTAPEGLPTVLLEAMHYATPVIASAIGGAIEIVQDQRTGLLVPPADVEALAQAMRKLLADADLRQQLGQAARRRVEDVFALKTQVEKLESVYTSVLERTS